MFSNLIKKINELAQIAIPLHELGVVFLIIHSLTRTHTPPTQREIKSRNTSVFLSLFKCIQTLTGIDETRKPLYSITATLENTLLYLLRRT